MDVAVPQHVRRAGPAPDLSLSAVAEQLAAAGSIETVAATVSHAARGLLRADGATLVLRDGERCHYADEDAVSPLWKGRRFPMSACISGWCMIHDEPVFLADIYSDRRIPADAYRPTFVRSLAMVPVRADRPVAAIGAYWSDHHKASEAELKTLQAIADTAAKAMARIKHPTGPAESAAGVTAGAPVVERDAGRAKPAGRARPSLSSIVEQLRRDGLRQNSPEAYAFAVLSVAAATAVRFVAGATGVHGLMAFTTYYPAMLLALLAGGAGPGVLAAALGGLLADLNFLPPYGQLGPFDLSHVLNLGLYAGATALMIATVQRYRARVKKLTAEDARHLTLARELEHRARNIFAVIQPIVARSLPADPDKAKTIIHRIRAAVAMDVTAASKDSVDVRNLLAFELEAFGLEQIRLSGEAATISAQAGASLGLALHELGANAVKYGALSTPDGRVSVSWTVAAASVDLLWVETEGPPVRPPERRGFGTVFLQRVLAAAGGSIQVDYPPDGVKARIRLPLRDMGTSRTPPQAA